MAPAIPSSFAASTTTSSAPAREPGEGVRESGAPAVPQGPRRGPTAHGNETAPPVGRGCAGSTTSVSNANAPLSPPQESVALEGAGARLGPAHGALPAVFLLGVRDRLPLQIAHGIDAARLRPQTQRDHVILHPAGADAPRLARARARVRELKLPEHLGTAVDRRTARSCAPRYSRGSARRRTRRIHHQPQQRQA